MNALLPPSLSLWRQLRHVLPGLGGSVGDGGGDGDVGEPGAAAAPGAEPEQLLAAVLWPGEVRRTRTACWQMPRSARVPPRPVDVRAFIRQARRLTVSHPACGLDLGCVGGVGRFWLVGGSVSVLNGSAPRVMLFGDSISAPSSGYVSDATCATMPPRRSPLTPAAPSSRRLAVLSLTVSSVIDGQRAAHTSIGWMLGEVRRPLRECTHVFWCW